MSTLTSTGALAFGCDSAGFGAAACSGSFLVIAFSTTTSSSFLFAVWNGPAGAS